MSYSARYQKQRLLDQSRGIEHTYIDPRPVTEHVRRLLAQGMTCRGIGSLAGVSPSTVVRFRDRAYDHAQRSTAAKILAVRPRLAYQPGHRGLVPAIGARRRIKGLLALGWSHDLITAELPDGARSRVILHRAGDSMTAELHAVVRAVYDRLSMTPGPSAMARARAARHGYLPPLAWDDDTIDDPNAVPDTGRKTRGSLDLDDWLYLVKTGEEPNRAAERCGVQITAVERAAHRAGRTDIASMAASARIRERSAVA